MKAYKATYNQKCINITYEVGNIYTFNGELEVCKQGFHFCKIPDDTLNYYNNNKDFILLEIEVLGEVLDKGNKSVTNQFKVLRAIPKNEINELFNNAEFDENGNLIHSKNSNGFEKWNTFDEKNNLIHFKNSNGFEYWNTFDENGNLIHSKDSMGDEYWNTFDENSNLIHYKDFKGEYWNTFNENNNLIHYKNSMGDEYSITITEEE